MKFFTFEPILDYNQKGIETKVLKNLEKNTTYIVTISAINDFGSSPPSNPVQVTTEAVTSEQTYRVLLYFVVIACCTFTLFQALLELCWWLTLAISFTIR